jgi:hypothetical protein
MSLLVPLGLVVGVVLLLVLSIWGYRNAPRLVVTALPADEQRRRVRTLRRGSVTCFAVAVALLAVGVHDNLIG